MAVISVTVSIFVSTGCLVTERINPAPMPPPAGNSPLHIDVSSVLPHENMIEFTNASGTCLPISFTVNRVLDEDAILQCYPDAGVPQQNFEARFFHTIVPSTGAITLMAQRNVFGFSQLKGASPGSGIDCDVLQQTLPFTLNPSDVTYNTWELVEIVVSDQFAASNRDPAPGHSSDSYSWLVRNVQCP